MTTPPFRPAGVLLDMDGTLVDTEPLWFAATREALRRLGADLPPAAEPDILGLEAEAAIELIATRYRIRVDRSAFDRALRAELGPALERARVRPGADAVVARILVSGIACAIVSNSSHEIITATLAPHPWAAGLTLRFSVDDVARGKPAPDLYRHAVQQLGLEPAHCVAIEDSPTGVSAATAAGIPCIAVVFDAAHRAALERLTPHVVSGLDEALALLDLADAVSETAAVSETT